MTYSECSNEVLTIARDLIAENHPHLESANIGFIFREEAAQSKGKSVYVRARKPPAWFEVFEEYDFIIEIAEDIYSQLPSERREALIDYALSFCGMGANGWVIKAPDFEGFRGNIARFGFWNHDLLQAASTFKEAQLRLPQMEIGTPDGKLTKVDPLKFERATREATGEQA